MKTQQQRYFIAIVPRSPISEVVTQLQLGLKDKFGTRAALGSPPHITLHMPFLWNEEKEAELAHALSSFADSVSPFNIELRDFGAFPPRVIFINVERTTALADCQHRLQRFCRLNLNLFNADYQDRPYHPHMTLAFRDLRKAAFPAAWLEFQDRSYLADFEAQGISLLKHNGQQWTEESVLPFQQRVS